MSDQNKAASSSPGEPSVPKSQKVVVTSLQQAKELFELHGARCRFTSKGGRLISLNRIEANLKTYGRVNFMWQMPSGSATKPKVVRQFPEQKSDLTDVKPAFSSSPLPIRETIRPKRSSRPQTARKTMNAPSTSRDYIDKYNEEDNPQEDLNLQVEKSSHIPASIDLDHCMSSDSETDSFLRDLPTFKPEKIKISTPTKKKEENFSTTKTEIPKCRCQQFFSNQILDHATYNFSPNAMQVIIDDTRLTAAEIETIPSKHRDSSVRYSELFRETDASPITALLSNHVSFQLTNAILYTALPGFERD